MIVIQNLLNLETKFNLKTESILFINTSKKTNRTLIHVKKNLKN